MSKIWRDEWEEEQGPDGSWREFGDSVLGWGLPLTVLGLAAWKVWDLIRLVVK